MKNLSARGGSQHHRALLAFMVIVIAHWGEHLVQVVQIWALGWPTPRARGILGLAFPWLISSEWLHYGYALVMLVALIALRRGFTGAARTWWDLTLIVQLWHHTEHFLLLVQAMAHSYLFGGSVPTSVLQTIFPRVELHLFYNTMVTIPMVVAIMVHHRASPDERPEPVRSSRTIE